MRQQRFFVAMALSACLVLACNNAEPVPSCKGTSIVATEGNNYSFKSTLTLSTVTVKPRTDLTFNWGSATSDFAGRSIDSVRDINSLLLAGWGMDMDEFQDRLNKDDVPQKELIASPMVFYPKDGRTSAKLLDFASLGGSTDPDTLLAVFDPARHDPARTFYTVVAQTGKLPTYGIRIIQAFRVDPDSTDTEIQLDAGSTHLWYEADLHTLAPTKIPRCQAALNLDWHELRTTALGSDVVLDDISEAFVASYTQTPAELEGDDFVRLDTIARKYYRAGVYSGTCIELSSLADSAGNTFAGIDDSGTWIVGLRCSTCRNPAPWYITVVTADP